MWSTVMAAAAAWLWLPEPASRRLQRLEPHRRHARGQKRLALPVVAALAGAALVVIVVGLGSLGWAAAAALASGTVTWIVQVRRREQAARRCATTVAAAARLLASLLRSGQIPTAALQEAADEYPVLARAAAASVLGTDVAEALERDRGQPGASGLGTLAAAWRVSERSGAPIADVLDRVAEVLREDRRIAGIVDTELASARASGHIMAVLPFAAIALGFFAGVNPLDFLFGQGIGQWFVMGAVALTACGVVWIERLARA